ncbi:MarR family transcriptional regulator [Mesorhizobium sp. NBSH29]|uniref:MarR family winged helix-turn-helix transcriptional regulator n=1 Tax=Mesorhizobium sp. NBSH29 TaxID=2654249 RepID=UPI0018964DE3|nr:winged helix DNA-binding protein [Mesorhizobium sp. NBSH29]QPC86002.1 MarR family transcriptional regulator [Mesorhizobium sp. NBSH29]
MPRNLIPDAHLTHIAQICFVRAARRTANLVTRVFNQHFAVIGLEVTQFSILCTIALERAQSASELADMVGVERSTLARNLARLIQAGLVVAEAGSGRRQVHRLTASGRDIVQQALPLWGEAQRELVETLPSGKDVLIRDDLRQLRHGARAVLGAAHTTGR